ncbi:MAG: hypothetical protein KF724_08545 [Phycisphaeraceae bacterium]|nr:hypothetical protein [Phycisphaeraceae bacterium]
MRSDGRRRNRTARFAALSVLAGVLLGTPFILEAAAAPRVQARDPSRAPTRDWDRAPATAPSSTVLVFDRVELSFEGADAPKDKDATTPRGDLILKDFGQTAERTLRLPQEPTPSQAMSVFGVVTVEPIDDPEALPRPGDPWTRLGSVGVVLPVGGGRPPMQVELMRFVTGFGAAGRFEADLTPLLPVLWGERTFRVHMGTWKNPGWRVSFELRYESGTAGIRRPSMVVPLIDEPVVKRGTGRMQASFTLLPGLDRPRLRVLSTGHGSEMGDEFRPRTHIVRVDGVEVARWRPWREDGARVRSSSPWAERRIVDGREVWASDADRSGWVPGRLVDPFVIPLDELTPGRHRVEIEVLDIRETPAGQPPDHWRVSMSIVADQAWPTTGAPAR